jgi:hypothetical protein
MVDASFETYGNTSNDDEVCNEGTHSPRNKDLSDKEDERPDGDE